MNGMRFMFALMAIVCAVAGCKMNSSQAAGGNVFLGTTDAIATDSVVYACADSAVTFRLRADFPTGSGELADSIRAMLSRRIAMVSLSHLIGCEEDTAVAYAGDLSDSRSMLAYYAQPSERELRQEQQELSQLSSARPFQLAYSADISKVADQPRYIAYMVETYHYLGGAHGSAMKYGVCVDKTTGQELEQTVDTLQIKMLQPLLRAGLVHYFRNMGETVTDAELDSRLFVENGFIPLPAFAPVPTVEGMRFVYQQYEIGPYAMDMADFTVPYADIKPYLTPQMSKLIEVAE